MYKSKWPLFKVLHRAFGFVNATQKLRRATTYIVQVPRARRDRKHYDIANYDRLTFKTNILLAFLNKHSTQYHNTILARRIKRSCEVAKTGDTSSLHCCFSAPIKGLIALHEQGLYRFLIMIYGNV